MYLLATIPSLDVTECICTLCLCCCTLCRSVNVLLCVDDIQSVTYALRVVILDVTKRRGERERERERERQYQRPLADTIRRTKTNKQTNKTKQNGTSGCGSFVVLYFQPATSIDRLHSYFLVSVDNIMQRRSLQLMVNATGHSICKHAQQ